MSCLTWVVLSAFAGASVVADDSLAEDAKLLQGVWQVVGAEAKGMKVDKDDADVKKMRIVIKDDGITLPSPGGVQDGAGTFKLDASKSPKAIDITTHDGEGKVVRIACIYKLDGNKLMICTPTFRLNKSIRPKEFKGGVADGCILLMLERVIVS